MKENRILVTGGSGLVGGALKKIMPEAVYVSSKDYNLIQQKDIEKMYKEISPNHVVHLAARVGGIFDNINHPAEYFDENIIMNTFMLRYAYEYGVERFLGILSSCIFPDVVENYPMDETDLHLGPPTKTNFSYGMSKRALAVQIDAYNAQYNIKYNYITPCNLFGESDKDDEEKSHFVTALIKKIYEANKTKSSKIVLYGDGTPLRQFMYVKDIASIIKIIIQNDITESFNVATEENISIKNIAKIALKATGSEHLRVEFDITKPNGQFRKDLSINKLKKLIPNFEFTRLENGIKEYYTHYKRQKDKNS